MRVAVVPCSDGAAVADPDQARVLPWDVARQLLDDPTLEVVSVARGGISPWGMDRWLRGLAAGEVRARQMGGVPNRFDVESLAPHPRTWARTIDLSILAGDVDGACCRTGLPLPGDTLAVARTAALLAHRHQGQIQVRQRLLADHPWIGEAAWLGGVGRLAEAVVLRGAGREAVRRRIVPTRLAVRDLLPRAERFTARRPDARAAQAAILDGTVAWSDRRLELVPAGGFIHPIGSTRLAIGVGGLHTLDGPGVVEGPLTDLDVASFYPALIAREGIHPPQVPEFASRVDDLLRRRLAAKRSGDGVASNALKYVINSLYGQLGNRRSGLFSPPDALRVVLTGQLRLIQLMDLLLEAGCPVVSANTDGVLVRGDATVAAAAARPWEDGAGLSLEAARYRRLFRTSVNDYVAEADPADGLGPGRVGKAKGRFGGYGGANGGGASQHSSAPVIARAAIAHLVEGRPVAQTIAQAGAVTDFCAWRRVLGRDLTWGGAPVDGAVVRWVVGPDGVPLTRRTATTSAQTIERRAIPVPDPAAVDRRSIDREAYRREAQRLVDGVLGTTDGATQASIFDLAEPADREPPDDDGPATGDLGS